MDETLKKRRKIILPHLPGNAITKWLLRDAPAAHIKHVSERDRCVDYDGTVVEQVIEHNLIYSSHHKVRTNYEWALAECDERNQQTKNSFYHIYTCRSNKDYICICKVNKDGSK